MSHLSAIPGDEWRASVATYNRVLFPHPQTGMTLLALERKAAMRNPKEDEVCVWSQPFGGAVRILDPAPLEHIVGELRFDCERSQREQDFRLLIPSSRWEEVKQYCLERLAQDGDVELESTPDRELAEEFEGTIGVQLKPQQYTAQAVGFVIENNPVPTDNIFCPGCPTVRVYRIFEVHIVDNVLCEIMLEASQHASDEDLGRLAQEDFRSGGRGRVNSALALPLDRVRESYLARSPGSRHAKIRVDEHELDESVLAVLGDIEVPQYERV